MPIRILIAEDQRLLRQCFRETLAGEPDLVVVGSASDGREALLLAEEHKPDVVLMDLAMPNLDGVKAAKIIRQRLPQTKILMLSLHDDPARVSEAMKVGVAGFVSKDVAFEELVRIIRAVWEGDAIQSPFLADQRIQQENDISRYGLSEREVRAMRLLVQGYNNNEIAQMLCVSEQTIKKEFVGIFERLGVRNRTQAAVKGVQMGLSEKVEPGKPA